MPQTTYTVTINQANTLIASENDSRHSIIINNLGAATLYVGNDTATTTATGIAIQPDGNLSEDSGGTRMYLGDYYGITGSTADVRVREVY